MLKKTREPNFDQKKEGYTLTGRPSFGTGAPNGAPCFLIIAMQRYIYYLRYKSVLVCKFKK